jgi:hypothetical protein
MRPTHLGKEDVAEGTGLLDELVVQVGIADEEVLEDAAVGCVGHGGGGLGGEENGLRRE